MTKVIQRCRGNTQDKLYFDWHITNWCNFKCSYCPALPALTNNFKVDNHTANHKLTLARLNQVKIDFEICITGGEPTLHPDLPDILKSLCENTHCEDISFFTNLSKPLNFYEELNTTLNSEKLVIMASYHPDYYNDRFLEKCLGISKLRPVKFAVHVSMSDNPAYWDKLVELLEVLRENDIPCKPCILTPTVDFVPNYTDEFYAKFEKYFNSKDNDGSNYFKDIICNFTDGTVEVMKDYELEKFELNKFKGYQCRLASFRIDIEGKIYTTCTDRLVPMNLGDGNLVQKEICPNDLCAGRRLMSFSKEQV
jgi:hypothetical protein